MDFVQRELNPWGEEVLVRASWDLLYAAFVLGVLFLIGHIVYLRIWAPAHKAEYGPIDESRAARVPERVQRHSLGARLFHWVMAAAMFVALFTAFLPIVGIQFAWVTIHWIAGIVLTASIIYHVIHATFWLDFWSIWINGQDVRDSVLRVKKNFGVEAPRPRRHGKYPVENKLYHYALLLTGLGVIVTGIFMMFRIETPLFARDPYMFSDQAWGMIYVIHGFSSIALVTLIMAHVYFGLRPEKLWITKSMIYGWIDKKDYLEHHDPDRWTATPPEAPAATPAPERREVTA